MKRDGKKFSFGDLRTGQVYEFDRNYGRIPEKYYLFVNKGKLTSGTSPNPPGTISYGKMTKTAIGHIGLSGGSYKLITIIRSDLSIQLENFPITKIHMSTSPELKLSDNNTKERITKLVIINKITGGN